MLSIQSRDVTRPRASALSQAALLLQLHQGEAFSHIISMGTFSESVPSSGPQSSPNDPRLHQNNSPSRSKLLLGQSTPSTALAEALAGRGFTQAKVPP